MSEGTSLVFLMTGKSPHLYTSALHIFDTSVSSDSLPGKKCGAWEWKKHNKHLKCGGHLGLGDGKGLVGF